MMGAEVKAGGWLLGSLVVLVGLAALLGDPSTSDTYQDAPVPQQPRGKPFAHEVLDARPDNAVQVRIKHAANDAHSYSASDFYLLDANGTVRPDSTVGTYWSGEGFPSVRLHRGEAAQGWIVFESIDGQDPPYTLMMRYGYDDRFNLGDPFSGA